jgi:hypothetical protein
MTLRPLVPETSASTNSATSAYYNRGNCTVNQAKEQVLLLLVYALFADHPVMYVGQTLHLAINSMFG